MIIQNVILALFAFLGLVTCTQIPSDAFSKFKQELIAATTGNQVGVAVNKPQYLAEFLQKLAEEKPKYEIPFKHDAYRLFRFYNGILAHYRARVVEKERLESQMSNKSLSISDIDKEIASLNDEATKERGLYAKLFSGKKQNLEKKQTERQGLQTELDTMQNRLVLLNAMFPKFDKFITDFDVGNEHKNLYDNNVEVREKLAKDKIDPADRTFIGK